MTNFYRATAFEREVMKASSFHDIFQLVQYAVQKTIKESRAGLNLGIMELGNESGKYLGAFYPAGSNIIVLNNTPMRRMAETASELINPYIFHVLLHEYLHSLGYLDESSVRLLSFSICSSMLGKDHPSSKMAQDIGAFLPNLVYPEHIPLNSGKMLLIEDIDGSMDYID
jgi:hypothetical protein